MNKTVIRIFAFLVFASPWVYVSSVYKDVFYIVTGLVILAATISIKKKKKHGDESGDKDSVLD
jgi:hypothetical protein